MRTDVLVLPGGGYATHVAHEAEPIVEWLDGLRVRASVFRYPLNARHPIPLDALQREVRRRREGGADRVGLVGFSAGGHLAGLAALGPRSGSERVGRLRRPGLRDHVDGDGDISTGAPDPAGR